MTSTRARLLGATVLASFAAATAAAAQTQPTPDAPIARQNSSPAVNTNPGSTNGAVGGQDKTPGAQSANGENTAVGEVVVTGSRIKRNDLESAQPLQVIGGDFVDKRGFINIADALNNQLPNISGSVTPNGDQGSFGTGRNFVNLFNLGSNRTLTLVNGRRFISDNTASNFSGISSGTQVDLNQIPTAFLDRVEVLTAGGSAVYGSDAVGGVVNVITKDKFKGVEVDAQYGRSERDDYPEYRARIAAGTDFLGGRGNIAATFEYAKTGSLLSTDRAVSRADYTFANNPLNTSATDRIPSSILITGRRVPETNPNGIPFRINSSTIANIITIPDPSNPAARIQAQFAPGGTLVPYNTGLFYQPSISAGGDGLDLAAVSALETPLERYLAGGIASFEITPHIRLKAEFNYSHVDSTEPANQPIYNSAIFGGTSGNIAINAATNPFLSAAARATILAQLPATAANTFYLSRSSTDLVGANNAVVSTTDSYRGVLDLEGDFSFLGHNYNWNIFYNHGETEGGFSQLQVNQQKFLFATNAVSNAAGQAVCAPLPATATAAQTAAYQGCQPLNLFGLGAPSAASLGYVQAVFSSQFLNKEEDAEANLSGPIYSLPGGDLAFSAGYEYRREESKFKPDANSQAGIGRSVPISPADGAFDLNEVYFEIDLPIFGKDFSFPGMRSLDFTFQDREVDNSLAGSGRAYSYEAKYSPFKDLVIRGTRSRSFRAPGITELFLPQSTAFSTATDPCDQRFINAGTNPTVRAANCAKAFTTLGLPANYKLTSTIVDATKMIITGGNPNLTNEIAEQFSYGFVYQPHFIPHLAITLDLENVRLVNAIGSFSLTSILSTCYDQPNQPPAVCSRFSRDATGQINDNAITGYVNAGYIRFQGLTANISYDFAPASLPYLSGVPGRVGIDVKAFNYERYESSVSGTGLDIVRSAGTIGLPRWKGTANISYSNGPLTVIATEQYQSAVRYDNTFTVENRDILHLGDYFRTDLSANYRFPHNLTGRVGVNNVFDNKPPYPTVSAAYYDVIGTYYFAGVNYKW